MIIFSLSDVALSKALGPKAPSTGVSIPGGGAGTGGGGGQRGGPGSAPRGGKYISREWDSTAKKWIYDYGDKPHPERHGLDFSTHDEGHSMMAPEHLYEGVPPAPEPPVDVETNPEAFKAHQAAVEEYQKKLEEVYFATRRSMIKPGMRWQMEDPEDPSTKYDVEVVTSGDKANYPLGYKIKVRELPTVDPTTGKEKKGRAVSLRGRGVKKAGASTLAALEKWWVTQKYTQDRYDPHTGKLAYSMVPNFGKVNRETDRIDPPHEGVWDRYNIIFPKGSHEHIGDLVPEKVDPDTGMSKKSSQPVDRMGKNDWVDVVHQVAMFEQANDTAAGAKESMGQLLEQKSPLSIARSANFPRERDPNRNVPSTVVRNGKPVQVYDKARKVYAKYDSPQQREQMFQSMVNDLKPEIEATKTWLFERGHAKDAFQANADEILSLLTPSDGTPGEFLVTALDRAVTRGRFNPLKKGFDGKPTKFETYLMKTVWEIAHDHLRQQGKLVAPRKQLSADKDQFTQEVGKQVAQRYKETEAAGGDDEIGTQMQEVGLAGETGPIDFDEAQMSKLNSRLDEWKTEQADRLREYGDIDPRYKNQLTQLADRVQLINDASMVPGFVNGLRDIVSELYADEPGSVGEFNEEVLDFVHDMVKSLTSVFVEHMAIKAMCFDLQSQLMKAKATEPDPTHEYLRKEGMDDNPSFLYRDQAGNYVRYTNAPEGSADYSPFGGAPRVHISEPSFDMAPEYFTPDGRKLTRAPHAAAQIQWNPNYHNNDPQNLWAGRWVNPVTGEHEFTYIDSDMRDHDKLRLHQMIQLVDTRIPHLRKHVNDLLHSDQPKDNIVGLAMAMVDQGRVHPVELVKIRTGDIEMHGDIVRFGRFAVHAGEKIQQIVHRMMTVRGPEDPFFSVPVMSNDPNSVIGIDTEFRTIGPHYIARLLNHCGTPLEGLLAYHATQTYSMQLQRCIQGTNVSLQCGHEFALLEVARRMGHDFENQPDINPVIKQIQETMIDPVVIEVMAQSAKASGDDQGGNDMTRQVVIAVPHVSANLQGHTNAEKEFSSWLHNYPYHEHAEVRRTYEPAA